MNQIQTSNLEQFKKQLNGNNNIIKTEKSSKKIIQTKKNLVLSVQSDFAGCSHIRNIWWFNYINAVYGKAQKFNCVVAPYFVTQNDLLMRARTLWFQRVMSPKHLNIINQYKNNKNKLKYKMVYDIDDYIWGKNELQGGTKEDGIPSYNFGSYNMKNETKKCAIDIMNLMDVVCVSSDYLGKMLKEHGVKTDIKLLKNTVMQSFWSTKKKLKIKEKIKKPKILWSASPSHWSEQRKLKGDIDNAWYEFIRKNVIDNKIEFIQMGGHIEQDGIHAPFFFRDLEKYDNFKTIGWLNPWQYHLAILENSVDFSIAPLVDNNFNRSKSDIKMIESYANGSLFIGTKFHSGFDSPYDDGFVNLYDDCSVNDIEDIISEHSEPEIYNDIIDNQYKYMHENGRYTESPKFVNYFTSLLV